METSAHPEADVATTSRQFPCLAGVIVFRLSLVLLDIGVLFVAVYWLRSIGYFTRALSTLLVLGIPSLAIAAGLVLRQRWAGWVAVAYDALLVSWSVGGRLVEYSLADNFGAVLFATVFLWAFLYEGAYLLRRLCDRRPAWLLFRLSVAVLLCIGGVMFVMPRIAAINRVHPLVAYADAHWFEMPRDLIRFDISMKKDPRTGYTVIDLDRVGGSDLIGRRSPDEVRLLAKNLGGGRWRIPGNARDSTGPVAVVRVSGFWPEIHKAVEMDKPDMTDGRRARLVLRAYRTRQSRLVYKGSVDAVRTLEVADWGRAPGSIRTVQFDQSMRALSSPESFTTYYVCLDGDWVFVRPERDIDVQ